MKKIIILKHGGGELANQLWNYISIYAFGLEKNAQVKNPSFFEYHSFFRFLPNENYITRSFSLFFKTPRRRAHIINKIGRYKYAVLAKIKCMMNWQCVFTSENSENKPTYLPPSSALPDKYTTCQTLYFEGWLFRNPVGIKKFRDKLIEIFRPDSLIEEKVDEIIKPIRQKYRKIIGIHIRQYDYSVFKGGKYLINQERVREIIAEYARENIVDANETLFLITSDGLVDQSLFKNLNIYVSKENAVVDLFLLSKTDTILGSDSSFGAFASWYGNIPHIIFKKEVMDWDYYSDKTTFFENKYGVITKY